MQWLNRAMLRLLIVNTLDREEEIMAEWQTIRLGEIVKTNQSTYSPKENWQFVNYLDTGNITVNKINEIQYIDSAKDKLPSRARRKVKTNSIIYSTVRPNQLHYGIIKEQPDNFLVSTGFVVIDVDCDKAVPDFIYYALTKQDVTEQLQAIAEQSVSAYTSIKPSDIENLEFTLPDGKTQERIVSILSTIDEKIKENNVINNNLEQQAEALFHSLFVENANPTWKDGVLSDLGTVVAGGTPSKTKPEYYSEHGIAWITPKDLSLNKSKFISHGENDISELGFSKSSATKMPAGTVLFSSRAPIGYIAIAANEVTTNQGFKSVVPNKNVGTAFMYYLLEFLLPTIEGMASGSTFKEISGAGMKSVPVVIPDNNIIEKFNAFCTPIFQQQEVLEAENSRLADIRDALLAKLMSGELDVSVIDL